MDLRRLGEKILTFFAVLMLYGIGNAWAQEIGSIIEFTDLIHDFGQINEADGPVTHVFEFENKGKVPYVIDFVSVSCGCTTPEYDKAPVMPGKKGSITITFDPAGRPGTFNKPIVITGNDRKDKVTVSIIGDVLGRPKTVEELYPIPLAAGLRTDRNSFLFGYMGRGETRSRSIEVHNSGNTPVVVSVVTEGNLPESAYSLKVIPETIAPGDSGEIMFTYDFSSDDVWGLVSTNVYLTVNGKKADMSLSAYATVTEDFTKWTQSQKENAPSAEFSAQFHHFNELPKGVTVEQKFIVVNKGKDPLILQSIKPNSSNITCTVNRREIKKGESAEITVKLNTSGLEGRVSESVTVIMNDPSRPMRELRLAATVK
ncbi:MAG: DUF1573 domain-containing protein [Rikenellaceae bacterium]|nr:DUF1573 domain-containing protein [Rikenellaceae bacterium]